MWIIVICCACGILIGLLAGMVKNQETKERGQALNQVLESVAGFTPTKKYYGEKNAFLFALDDEDKKVLYVSNEKMCQFDYEDIISVELLEDNVIVSKVSTSRAIGGAILGGIVAGNVGAIVGGLSGASNQRTLHTSIVVKILLRDTDSPALKLICFDSRSMTANGQPAGNGDMAYDRCIQLAHNITYSIKVIIDAVDREDRFKDKIENSRVYSVADELEKLGTLKEKGVLTEEEFIEQKAKLLKSKSV